MVEIVEERLGMEETEGYKFDSNLAYRISLINLLL